ncbi:MAG: hypothetical protein ABGY41_18740, partial [Candidatus Poribacteria bacterium]
GFAAEGADAETLRSAARALNPEYPGIFDVALWDLGRTVCGPRNPNCPACGLRDACPTGTGVRPAQPTVSKSAPHPEPAPRAAARTESQPHSTREPAPSPNPTSNASVASSSDAIPARLRDALLSPRHVGKVLDADVGLRKAFYALYDLCMSLSGDVRMTDNKTHLHFKRFDGSSRLFAKVKIRPQPGKMNVSIWSRSAIPLGYARDVRLLDTPDEDCELEISSVSQVEQAKPHIMESFRAASTPDVGKA